VWSPPRDFNACGPFTLFQYSAYDDYVFDEGFYVTGVFRSTQAFCLGGVGRFSRAEEVFLNALNILDTALGPDSSHSVTLRGRLAKMYDDWGKPDLAAAIRSR